MLWAVGPSRSESELDSRFVRRAHELNAPNIAHATDDGTMIPLEPPAYGRLRDIRSPALVMVGDHDLSSTLAHHDHLIAELPDVTGYRFSDAAHLPSVERPDVFVRVLRRWLGEHGL